MQPVQLARTLRCSPQSLGDIPEATRMGEDALEDDPLQHYLRDTPDASTGHYRESWRLHFGASLAFPVRKGLVWTIGDSDAMVTSSWPADLLEDDLDKLIKNALSLFTVVSDNMLTEQQRQRQTAFITLFRQAILEFLGNRVKDMFELGGLATRPSKQGRGYGSALVRVVTDLADAVGCATWLGSSNVQNTGFYESLGFVAITTISLGESDPTWNEPPVVVALMVREPRPTAVGLDVGRSARCILL
ncbi:hypothetical protein BC835DRAFT_1326425 [Cytidiella melzeri]|nr:hypothetical protein BC835DRAFT_1326425 [Cytidiella melzeri]